MIIIQPEAQKNMAKQFGKNGICCDSTHRTNAYDIPLPRKTYKDFRLSVMPGLCSDLILGLDFQAQHDSVTFMYGGTELLLSVCSLTTLNIEPPSPFSSRTADCHPIVTKSRCYRKDDLTFIDTEVACCLRKALLSQASLLGGLKWSSQRMRTTKNAYPLVTLRQSTNSINWMHFPLPRISDTINKIGQYKVFSTLDLQSVYHQIPLKEDDKPYTAFEAKGGLYQFTRLPFRVTNGVACFQREVMEVVGNNHLKAVFPYLDNMAVCGKDQADHDANLRLFMEAVEKVNLKFNCSKNIFSA